MREERERSTSRALSGNSWGRGLGSSHSGRNLFLLYKKGMIRKLKNMCGKDGYNAFVLKKERGASEGGCWCQPLDGEEGSFLFSGKI